MDAGAGDSAQDRKSRREISLKGVRDVASIRAVYQETRKLMDDHKHVLGHGRKAIGERQPTEDRVMEDDQERDDLASESFNSRAAWECVREVVESTHKVKTEQRILGQIFTLRKDNVQARLVREFVNFMQDEVTRSSAPAAWLRKFSCRAQIEGNKCKTAFQKQEEENSAGQKERKSIKTVSEYAIDAADIMQRLADIRAQFQEVKSDLVSLRGELDDLSAHSAACSLEASGVAEDIRKLLEYAKEKKAREAENDQKPVQSIPTALLIELPQAARTNTQLCSKIATLVRSAAQKDCAEPKEQSILTAHQQEEDTQLSRAREKLKALIAKRASLHWQMSHASDELARILEYHKESFRPRCAQSHFMQESPGPLPPRSNRIKVSCWHCGASAPSGWLTAPANSSPEPHRAPLSCPEPPQDPDPLQTHRRPTQSNPEPPRRTNTELSRTTVRPPRRTPTPEPFRTTLEPTGATPEQPSASHIHARANQKHSEPLQKLPEPTLNQPSNTPKSPSSTLELPRTFPEPPRTSPEPTSSATESPRSTQEPHHGHQEPEQPGTQPVLIELPKTSKGDAAKSDKAPKSLLHSNLGFRKLHTLELDSVQEEASASSAHFSPRGKLKRCNTLSDSQASPKAKTESARNSLQVTGAGNKASLSLTCLDMAAPHHWQCPQCSENAAIVWACMACGLDLRQEALASVSSAICQDPCEESIIQARQALAVSFIIRQQSREGDVFGEQPFVTHEPPTASKELEATIRQQSQEGDVLGEFGEPFVTHEPLAKESKQWEAPAPRRRRKHVARVAVPKHRRLTPLPMKTQLVDGHRSNMNSVKAERSMDTGLSYTAKDIQIACTRLRGDPAPGPSWDELLAMRKYCWSGPVHHEGNYVDVIEFYLCRPPLPEDAVRTQDGREVTFAEFRELASGSMEAVFPIQVHDFRWMESPRVRDSPRAKAQQERRRHQTAEATAVAFRHAAQRSTMLVRASQGSAEPFGEIALQSGIERAARHALRAINFQAASQEIPEGTRPKSVDDRPSPLDHVPLSGNVWSSDRQCRQPAQFRGFNRYCNVLGRSEDHFGPQEISAIDQPAFYSLSSLKGGSVRVQAAAQAKVIRSVVEWCHVAEENLAASDKLDIVDVDDLPKQPAESVLVAGEPEQPGRKVEDWLQKSCHWRKRACSTSSTINWSSTQICSLRKGLWLRMY
eukprot:TRINITY_DN16577_c0_g1_i1.p1 TRINITY_DN16577_c0_g1~~TRINITY_DN16577_c0_g1_i1.p1  ORF type:complete len:1190 (+),score=162.36 TRINITY_DN16577_c0_g1_i1:124-3693(+)